MIKYRTSSGQHRTPPLAAMQRQACLLVYISKFSRRYPISENPPSASPSNSALLTHHLPRDGCGWPMRISLLNREARCPLRNFDTEPPFSYCYELQRSIAGKASLTRVPPPICALAAGFQFVAEPTTVGAANDPSDSMSYVACNGCGRESYAKRMGFASAK